MTARTYDLLEQWRDVKGYEGQYEISSWGNVRAYPTKTWKYTRFPKTTKDKDGYARLCLYKKNHRKGFLIHRLIAEAFIPNPDNLPCINHKDENPRNNSVYNLEWCTRAYNNRYGTGPERVSQTLKRLGLNNRPVICMETGERFKSATEAASTLDHGNSSIIIGCCRGRRNTHKGYHWKYAEVVE